MRYFVMGQHGHRALVPFDRPTAFWWESPSGKRLLAWRADHYMTGNLWSLHGERLEPVERELLRYLDGLESRGYPCDRVAVQYSGYLSTTPRRVSPAMRSSGAGTSATTWPRLRSSTVERVPALGRAAPRGRAARSMRRPGPTGGPTASARRRASWPPRAAPRAGWRPSRACWRCARCWATPPGQDTLERVDSAREQLVFYGEHTYGAAESISDPGRCQQHRTVGAQAGLRLGSGQGDRARRGGRAGPAGSLPGPRRRADGHRRQHPGAPAHGPGAGVDRPRAAAAGASLRAAGRGRRDGARPGAAAPGRRELVGPLGARRAGPGLAHLALRPGGPRAGRAGRDAAAHRHVARELHPAPAPGPRDRSDREPLRQGARARAGRPRRAVAARAPGARVAPGRPPPARALHAGARRAHGVQGVAHRARRRRPDLREPGGPRLDAALSGCRGLPAGAAHVRPDQAPRARLPREQAAEHRARGSLRGHALRPGGCAACATRRSAPSWIPSAT